MRIYYEKDYEQMSRRAANIIRAQVTLKPDSVLGLPTGSSPVGTYKQLVSWYSEGDIDFSQCKSVNLDEYVGLSRECPQSYWRFMHENFFDHVNMKPENINLPDGTNPDLDAECARYDAVIDSLGGIDIQLLGIGHDGHIGFNEPENCFASLTHVVSLTERTIQSNLRFFEKIEDVPTRAVTMGIQSIMHAKKTVMVINGADKADILCAMVTGPVEPAVPASVLRFHRDFTLIADADALSVLLKKAPGLVLNRPL